jgi:hypothetical protein
MPMDSHRGAVDHLHMAVIGSACRGHDAVPNARLAPPHEAVVAGFRRAVLIPAMSPSHSEMMSLAVPT